MKNSKLFTTSLVAAAAMSTVPVWAEDTAYSSDTTIATDTTIDGKISVNNGATVTQTAGTVSATRLVLNDSDAKRASFYALTGGVLNISGDGKQESSETADNAILIGHWPNGTSKLTVSGGVLNATSGITTISWDSAGTLEVSGGEANLYGISLNQHRGQAANVTLASGRLNLGVGGLTYGGSSANKTVTLSGGTLGALDSWSSSATMTIGGNVTIDTTKWVSSATGDNTGATITLSGNITQTAGKLTVSGAGTLKLSGTSTLNGSVTVDSGATLDLSGATNVKLSSAITNSGTVKVNSSTIFVLAMTGTDNTYTVISGGTISGWDSTTLSISNFCQADGSTFSGRSTVNVATAGVVTITGVAANLVWSGGTSGTWDTTTQNWLNGSSADKFYSKDNVTFSAGQTVSVSFSDNLTAGNVTIAGSVTLADSITGTLTGEIVVATGGTLTVGKSYASSGGSGVIRGSLTIQNGGKASFNVKDVCGWSNLASSRLDALTVDSGGTLEINHNDNETFRGTLTLNGTLTRGTSGGDSTAWDLFGGSAKIVTTIAGAKIESGANIRFRQNNSEINVGSGASLEIASIISKASEGNGLLRKTGAGTLTLSGANTYSGGTTIEAGTVLAKNASALGNGTGNTSISANAELKLDLGSGTTMTQSTGTISGDADQSAKLTIASGKLVLTSATNNFKGTVDILSGGTLELNSGAKLLTSYSNTSKIWIRSGGELRMTTFAYDALGASPDYANHRQIDGGRISITGETSSSGQGFTVTSNGGEFLMEQSGQTLTLTGNGNSSTIDLGGALKIGGAGDIVINKNNNRVAIAGNGSLEKVGAGTLTINSAGNTYTGGTTVTEGKLIVGSSDALGTGKVTVASGAKLGLVAGTTVTGVSGVELAFGAKIVVDMTGQTSTAETFTLDLLTSSALSYNNTSITNDNVGTLLGDVVSLSGWDKTGWTQTLSYTDSTLKLTMTIPEPSAFGLLAGVGALALVAARRRRRKTK